MAALSDPHVDVRGNACWALGGLGISVPDVEYSAAVSELIDMLENADKVERNRIHNALVSIVGRPLNGSYDEDRRIAAEAWRGVKRRR